jgi:hypothetical protein
MAAHHLMMAAIMVFVLVLVVPAASLHLRTCRHRHRQTLDCSVTSATRRHLTGDSKLTPCGIYNQYSELNSVHGHSRLAANPDGQANTDKVQQTGGVAKRTCKQCKTQYDPNDNSQSAASCRFHAGIYSGRLNRINDVDTSGLEFFWSCCGEYELASLGCVRAPRHTSVRLCTAPHCTTQPYPN